MTKTDTAAEVFRYPRKNAWPATRRAAWLNLIRRKKNATYTFIKRCFARTLMHEKAFYYFAEYGVMVATWPTPTDRIAPGYDPPVEFLGERVPPNILFPDRVVFDAKNERFMPPETICPPSWDAICHRLFTEPEVYMGTRGYQYGEMARIPQDLVDTIARTAERRKFIFPGYNEPDDTCLVPIRRHSQASHAL